MFMKRIFYSLPVFGIISLSLFSSCSKSTPSSSNNNNNSNVSDLVASFSNYNSATKATTTYTFSYDGENRLIEEQISDGTPTIMFTYGSGTVTETQGTTTTIYTLNNAGFATSDNQGNTYTYNSNGDLTNVTNTDGASTVNTISNNNLVSSVQTTSTGTITSYEYTYLNNLNTLKFGLTFLGTPDVNLIQSQSINGVSYPFSYTYDSYNRVETETIVSGPTNLIRTYTYEN